MHSSNTDAWNRYWKDGRGAACQSDDEGGYHGIIGERWKRVFGSIHSPRRLIDLACGNGALAHLASSGDSGAKLDIHCVDAARIRPRPEAVGQKLSRLRYYPQTPNESLPFAANMFDGCVSQYGFEYGDADASVAEACRVLKPTGWIHWICHWRDGDIARSAEDEARRAGALRELELPNRIARLVECQQRGGRYMPDSHRQTWHLPQARDLKQGLSDGFRIARSTPQQANGNLGVFLHNLAYLYQHREQHPVEVMLEKMEECEEELVRHQQRLEALVSAALTPQRLEHLRRLLGSQGFPLQSEELLREPSTRRVVGIELHAGDRMYESAAGRNEQIDKPARQTWQWTDYWREGSHTTFGEGHFEDAYDDAIADFWRSRAANLPDDARLVDMGCGNGAVLCLLADLAARLERPWTLIGVDSADLETASLDTRDVSSPARMELHAKTSMEATGIEQGSVDLACGNFGFEYGKPGETIAELVRILKPGGQLAAVMHHPESAIAVQARKNEAAITDLLDRQAFARRVTELVQARFDQRRETAERAERRVRQIVSALESANPGSDSYPLQVARHFLGAAGPDSAGLGERLSFIERFSDSVNAWRNRMSDMREATMDEDRFRGWVETLRKTGFTNIETGELRHGTGGLLGRTLTATRR